MTKLHALRYFLMYFEFNCVLTGCLAQGLPLFPKLLNLNASLHTTNFQNFSSLWWWGLVLFLQYVHGDFSQVASYGPCRYFNSVLQLNALFNLIGCKEGVSFTHPGYDFICSNCCFAQIIKSSKLFEMFNCIDNFSSGC